MPIFWAAAAEIRERAARVNIVTCDFLEFKEDDFDIVDESE